MPSTNYPITEKQQSFLSSLHQQVHGFDVDGGWLVNLTKQQASAEIDALLTLKKAAKSATGAVKQFVKAYEAAPELEAGMYRKDGVIYKVYRTVHGANTICAKRLNEVPVPAGEPRSFEFEYVGLAAKHGILAAHRMSLDEAKAFGAIYGVCCVCSATLTDEVSIQAGIGPICGSRV